MNRDFLISIAVFLLIIACVLFKPPIYNRYAKPLGNNYVAEKKWYGKIDLENIEQVR